MGYMPYHELEVWQRAMTLVEEIYKLTKLFPSDERYGLVTQMRRAAVSIPSNIAEGKSRGTRKDYCRFVFTASGSAAELHTQIQIAIRLGFVFEEQSKKALSLLDEVTKMLKGLIFKLRPSPKFSSNFSVSPPCD
jgi:four helix bundle protein